MTRADDGRILVLRENGEWLRFVLWGAAIGMSLLAAHELAEPTPDTVRWIACVLGGLLLGFSGFALQIRRVSVDLRRRELVLTRRSAGRTSTQVFGFDRIRSILMATTLDSVEDARGREVLRKRWNIALQLDEGRVELTANAYVNRRHALRDATRLKELLRVEIVDDEAGGAPSSAGE